MTDPVLLRPTVDDAFAAYEALVRANREQIARLREAQEDGDFWAPRAADFRPGGLDAPELEELQRLARPDDTWLDVGAGGGRFAVPLSAHVARVVALEPSPSMRATLAGAAEGQQRTNIEVVDLRWPPAVGVDAPSGDAALVANVLYDAAELRAFIDALEAHTRRLCVVITSDRAPSTPDAGVWQALHGEALCALPALPELLAVLGALGRRVDVRTFEVPPPRPVPPEQALEGERWRYWVREGSPKDERLRALLLERFRTPSGLVQPPPRRNYSAVVSWPPPTAAREA